MDSPPPLVPVFLSYFEMIKQSGAFRAGEGVVELEVSI